VTISTLVGVLVILLFLGIVFFISSLTKINSYLKFIACAILITFPFTIINLANSIYANNVSVINIICTLLFILSWLVFSLIQGYKKQSSFKKFIMGYWLLSLLSAWLGNLLGLSAALFALFNLVPMYGLYYYVQKSFSGINYILILLVMIISWTGFLIGEKFIPFVKQKSHIN